MRYIELRRHTMRHKPGKNRHLTQAGVSLARRVGESMGPFARVITSDIPRAFETAIAMGFAVDDQSQEWSTYGEAVEVEIGNCVNMADLAKVTETGKATAKLCKSLAELMKGIAQGLNEGESALVVSHGGVLEIACIGCLPRAKHSSWGDYFGYCEGARLAFSADEFVSIELLRV